MMVRSLPLSPRDQARDDAEAAFLAWRAQGIDPDAVGREFLTRLGLGDPGPGGLEHQARMAALRWVERCGWSWSAMFRLPADDPLPIWTARYALEFVAWYRQLESAGL